MIPIKKPIAKLDKAEVRLTAASADVTSNGTNNDTSNDTSNEVANSTADLDHEKFMKENGIKTVDLSDEIKEIDKVLKNAKDDDFESANKVSRLVVEALQESISEINESIEEIGETLADQEQRIEALESLPDAPTDTTETVTTDVVADVTETVPTDTLVKLTDEQILKDLHNNQRFFVTKEELKNLGFKTGFFSTLNSRGGTYGAYSLQKQPSQKVYNVILN